MKGYTNAHGAVTPMEKVLVNVTSDNGVLPNGFIITITDNKGTVLATTGESSYSISIPYDTEYIVSASSVDGYITPASQTFTASQPLRNVNVGYKCKPIGVCIVDADGDLVDVASWTGGSNATGIYVSDGEHSLIVAPDEWHTYKGSDDGAWNGNKKSAWGGRSKTVSNIVTTTDESTALTDFAGSSNTDQIISQLKGTTDEYSSYYTGAPAAEYCRAYSKGCKGVGEWYLPAMGEVNVIATNKDAINEALTKISGENLGSDGSIWTSTQADDKYAWHCNWYSGIFIDASKAFDGGVRPICQF